MEETANKGRVWNGYVCPGCRSVFRVPGDFDGHEVICPTCQECLKLPDKPADAPPLVGARPTPKIEHIPAPQADEPPVYHDDTEPVSANRRGRLTLALLVLVPALLITAVVSLLPDKKTDPPAEKNTAQSDGNSESVPREITPQPVSTAGETQPTPPDTEIAATPPPAVPDRIDATALADPVDAPGETPPVVETAPAPPLPDPEEGLVAAVPNIPGAGIAPPSTLPDISGDFHIHVVQSGETLSSIARRNSMDVAAIKQLNNLQSDLLVVGQQLRIPGVAKPAPAIEIPPVVSTPEPAPVEVTPEPAPVVEKPPRKHKVVRGDTLTRIARQYGCETADIKRLNGLKSDVIRLGAELLIPPSED